MWARKHNHSDERSADADRGRWSLHGGRGFGRLGGMGDDVMSWALSLGTVRGIRIRLHLLFIVFVAARLLRAYLPVGAGGKPGDKPFVIISLVSLFIVVLLHEFGHCAACRAVDGEADDILMWPLGGLATCRPPRQWKANLVTVMGGPAVNVLICLLLTPLLIALIGNWHWVIFNPLKPGAAFALWAVGGRPDWWLIALWWTNYLSFILLAFNLLPMYPLDGAQIVQSLIWRSAGHCRATEIASLLGYAGAVVLGVVGLATGEIMLLGIALFGAAMSWQVRRQLSFIETAGEDQFGAGFGVSASFKAKYAPQPPEKSGEDVRDQRRESAREEIAEGELDRILAKIQSGGINSLSRKEKRQLRQETSRRKKT